MNSNNLTTLLTALAVVPLYFKETSQPAPEKWSESLCGVSRVGSGYSLYSETIHDETQARKGPTGEWVISRNGEVLERYPTEGEALRRMAIIAGSARSRMGQDGWCPYQVEVSRFGIDRVYFRKRLQ